MNVNLMSGMSLSLKTFLIATISLSLAYSICPSPSPSLYMMIRLGSFPLASRYLPIALATAGPIPLITSSLMELKMQVLHYLVKVALREATRAPTSVPFLEESLSNFPLKDTMVMGYNANSDSSMIMVFLRGK